MKNMKVNGQSTRHNNRNRPTAGLNVLYKERKTVANKKRSTEKT
jgi:ribosomal protein S13